MRVIRFKHNYPPYNAGETAGFADEMCDVFVAKGIAEATDIAPYVAPRSPEQDPPTATPAEMLLKTSEASQRAAASRSRS
jgi:hypothetical protein